MSDKAHEDTITRVKLAREFTAKIGLTADDAARALLEFARSNRETIEQILIITGGKAENRR